jgi:hypothetical protein
MGVYSPLGAYLTEQNIDHVSMTFAEIEEVLGRPLPPSKRYPAWWSNNPSNNPMTREWLSAGFQTESVNVSGGKLVFRRVQGAKAGMNGGSGKAPETKSRTGFPFGFMTGLLSISPGHDVAKPLDVDWGESFLDKVKAA